MFKVVLCVKFMLEYKEKVCFCLIPFVDVVQLVCVGLGKLPGKPAKHGLVWERA